MKALADMLISAAELLEAEGRNFRRWAFQVGLGLSLIFLACLLAAAGALLLGGALVIFLGHHLGAVAAGLIVGPLALACAGGLLWQARKLIHHRR